MCESRKRNFKYSLDMIDKINHINPEYFENKIKKNIANSISAENTIVNLINIMLS